MRGLATIPKSRPDDGFDTNVQPDPAAGQQALLVARFRQKLIDAKIPRDDRLTAVLQALKKIPASAFPLADGQRSQDEFEEIVAVAFMAALLRARKEEPVLQIGFGSGYEAAVLGRISRLVVVEEGDAQHARSALARLARIGTGGVRWTAVCEQGGEPEFTGYAHIFVTDAMLDLPQAVGRRLRTGGRLVARVGGGTPHYVLGLKRRDGTLRVLRYARDTFRLIGLPSR